MELINKLHDKLEANGYQDALDMEKKLALATGNMNASFDLPETAAHAANVFHSALWSIWRKDGEAAAEDALSLEVDIEKMVDDLIPFIGKYVAAAKEVYNNL